MCERGLWATEKFILIYNLPLKHRRYSQMCYSFTIPLYFLWQLKYFIPLPQTVITKVTANHDRELFLKANEPSAVKLQAQWRGYKARKDFDERKDFLNRQLPAIIKIQVRTFYFYRIDLNWECLFIGFGQQ